MALMRLLRIQLLGDFLLTRGGTPITRVNSPRLQSLLAYIVLHHDAPQSRQHLAFLFWPDCTEAHARNNLRQLLFELRHALPDADCFLDVESATVRWCADAPFTLDVAEFEERLTADRELPTEDAHSAIERLQSAVALYRGDLLPGCYDDWIVPEREQLRDQFIGAFTKLIALLENAHDYPAAIACAQRLLRHDPLDEATYRRLMRLHTLSADRAGLVRVFKTCAAVLRRELDVEPSTETRQSYEQLLEMRPPPRAAVGAFSTTALPLKNNLPFQVTSFIGREREKSELKQLVATHPVLTLTGTGGVGKTRLALAVASELLDAFPDGVWWVDLAALANPTLLPQEVVSAMGVRQAPGPAPLDLLPDLVRDKTMLIVLNNCEHMVDAIRRLIGILLPMSPNLRILVTSRGSLWDAHERIWQVPPLAFPVTLVGAASDPATLAQYESVRLFEERANAALPTFALTQQNVFAVAQICRRLDGIPLAIELAAARVRLLTIEQIAHRLDDALRLLARSNATTLPRHQTLRATMDWSFQLLTEKERILLRRLSVFAGSFTIEAIETICAGDGLAQSEILDAL
ncbi:MAG: hypothetical protein KGJ80_19020, partial [Chloroflexota bacterium]|nr:hypothetical protein [Chloroflexota bacterium]